MDPYTYGMAIITTVGVVISLILMWLIGYSKNPDSSYDGWCEAFRMLKARNRQYIYLILTVLVLGGLSYIATIQYDATYKLFTFFFGMLTLMYLTIQCQRYRIICGISEIPKREPNPRKKELRPEEEKEGIKDEHNKSIISMP
jgi:hypothetical protein